MEDSNPIDIDTALYLFPVPLSQGGLDSVLPNVNIELVKRVKYFIVENVRSARRFLKMCDRSIDIDSLTFSELNRHTDPRSIPSMLDPLALGHPIGVISEAGCPAIADPGADVVAIAQRRGFKIVPLVGPSSILLSLMASGFNGQSFAFNGYLPIDKDARAKVFKNMQQRIVHERQTQIFIETPYRNNKLIAELASSLPGNMLLCVASDITGPAQSIVTKPCSAWKKDRYNYDKIPAIFLLFN
ncbi:MAG: SAM-dependent methyltransferase [Clostridiales bacterium]|nr:SAM-dependent methyltransferase [Clostridiales bacterium]